VFLDKREFHAGVIWDMSIYENISTSDVMLVIITPDAASPWVQREVDYALGCRIEILPIVIRQEHLESVDVILKKLAIEKVQYAKAFGSNTPALRYGEIIQAIPKLLTTTRERQEIWVKQLQRRWRDQDKSNPAFQPYSPTKLLYASYAYFADLMHAHSCKIRITAGNITEVKNIDVIVNSENVYMQMQRVFAPESVSKRIRIDGARTSGRHFIREDSVQRELNTKLFGEDGASGGGVPVDQGTVIVTEAGDSESKLRKRGIRYIFHVAIVDADTESERTVTNSDVVYQAVLECLDQASNLKTQQPVTSIIFPVLASGNAGLQFSEAVGRIIQAIKNFLSENPHTNLRDIHISAFTNGDVSALQEILDNEKDLKRIDAR